MRERKRPPWHLLLTMCSTLVVQFLHPSFLYCYHGQVTHWPDSFATCNKVPLKVVTMLLSKSRHLLPQKIAKVQQGPFPISFLHGRVAPKSKWGYEREKEAASASPPPLHNDMHRTGPLQLQGGSGGVQTCLKTVNLMSQEGSSSPEFYPSSVTFCHFPSFLTVLRQDFYHVQEWSHLLGQRFSACFVLKFALQRGEAERGRLQGVQISKLSTLNLLPKKYLETSKLFPHLNVNFASS